METLQIIREKNLVQNVVFIGGIGGCGKSMMVPIVGSLRRVELQKYDYTLEHICTLFCLEKISADVATTLIRMQVDMDLYNLMMSRETNFRFNDLSSVFKNPGTWRYIRRLFQAGDEVAVQRIEQEKPILNIVMHDSLQRSRLLFLALGTKAHFIEVVRHPLYMLKQWMMNVELLLNGGGNPREFGIWFDYKGKTLPWFARGWEEKYLTSNSMDKVIYLLERHIQEADRVYQSLSPQEKNKVLIVPFERFVVHPWPFIKNLENLLETKTTSHTARVMKKQRVPRKKVADGIGRAIYKKYGWESSSKNSSEAEEYRKRREYAAGSASKEGMEILDRLCCDYERNYLQTK